MNATTSPRQIFRCKGYVLYSIIVSLGGFLNGYDTGSIGAVTEMPSFKTTIRDLSPTMQGFTVALIMLMGAVPGILAGGLADRFGHLRIVISGALTFTIGAALQAGSRTLSTFLVGRALAGIGQGLWITNVSVYITEIAPSAQRGKLVSIAQFMAAVGICSGYFTCYGSIHIGSDLSFRLPFILQAVVSLGFALSCLYLPMSPRWLLANGHRAEALDAIECLEIPRAEAEKDILGPRQQSDISKLGVAKAFFIIFRQEYRARTMLAFFVLGAIQLCGIDGVLYYAPVLFAQAGLPEGTASFLASGVSAILMLLISIPAFLYADRWGRRASIITGGILLSSCMFIIGGLYASNVVHAHAGAGRWLVIILIFAFALSYCATWGVAGKIYASEIQPPQTRATTNSVAQGLNFFTNWLVAFSTPIFLAHSSYGAYFLFGGISLLSVTILAMHMPETRGYSLEYIQGGFQALATDSQGERRRIRKFLSAPVLPDPELSHTNYIGQPATGVMRIELTIV
ncbi:polyol transporter 2-like protein 1 [Phlyctema vagabunda]|uniref:Polyol transporter 2-like protein 1 n=1 Tax=Phlyctema vagabunda TaxID=108571 RepID=A0ABR4P6P0_9HELO